MALYVALTSGSSYMASLSPPLCWSGAPDRSHVVVAQRVKSISSYWSPAEPMFTLPPNKPAKVQLHFLNSTHRLRTIKPGIHLREKMVLKSILMTPLPLSRGRLMPAHKILLRLVLFSHFLILSKQKASTWRKIPDVLEKVLQGHFSRSLSGWTGYRSARGRLISAKCVFPGSAVCRSWNALGPINHATSDGMPLA